MPCGALRYRRSFSVVSSPAGSVHHFDPPSKWTMHAPGVALCSPAVVLALPLRQGHRGVFMAGGLWMGRRLDRDLEDARRLAEALAVVLLHRDYPGKPCYLLFGHEVGIPLESGTWGTNNRDLDLVCRSTLEHRRRWRGRGPCCLINHRALLAGLADHKRMRRRWVAQRLVVGTSIHEWGHLIDLLFDFAAPAGDAETISRMAAAMCEAWGRAPRLPPGFEGAPPWLGHECRFVRACIHFWHRAAAVVSLQPGDVLDGPTYGLSPASAYAEALDAELQAFAGQPVRAVLDEPADPAFDALWREDVRRWAERTTDTEGRL
jgi:hypothetical protein